MGGWTGPAHGVKCQECGLENVLENAEPVPNEYPRVEMTYECGTCGHEWVEMVEVGGYSRVEITNGESDEPVRVIEFPEPELPGQFGFDLGTDSVVVIHSDGSGEILRIEEVPDEGA